MTNHGDGDNDRNEDGNDNNNVASGSVFGGLIVDLIATPWSRLGIAEEDQAKMAAALHPQRHMCLRVGIY